MLNLLLGLLLGGLHSLILGVIWHKYLKTGLI